MREEEGFSTGQEQLQPIQFAPIPVLESDPISSYPGASVGTILAAEQ